MSDREGGWWYCVLPGTPYGGTEREGVVLAGTLIACRLYIVGKKDSQDWEHMPPAPRVI